MNRLALISLLFLVCSCKYFNDEKGGSSSDAVIFEKSADSISDPDDGSMTDSTDISAISVKEFREFIVLDSKYMNVNILKT